MFLNIICYESPGFEFTAIIKQRLWQFFTFLFHLNVFFDASSSSALIDDEADDSPPLVTSTSGSEMFNFAFIAALKLFRKTYVEDSPAKIA